MPHCIVPGCSSNSTAFFKDQGIKLHLISKNLNKQWLKRLNRKYEPAQTQVICSLHFEMDCYNYSGANVRLRKNAIPTLKIPSDNTLLSTQQSSALETNNESASNYLLPSSGNTNNTENENTVRLVHTYSLNSMPTANIHNTMFSRCRLCANVDQKLLIMNKELENRVLILFNLNIDNMDSIPHKICISCEVKVNSSWQFYKQVQKGQEQLKFLNQKLHEESVKEQTVESIDIVKAIQMYSKIEEQEFENNNLDLTVIVKTNTENSIDELVDANKCDLNEDGSLKIRNSVEGWDKYPYLCSMCYLQFPNIEGLTQHFLPFHQTQPNYRCADCDEICSNLQDFLAHVYTHRPILRFCCDICWKWFPNTDLHAKHINFHLLKNTNCLK